MTIKAFRESVSVCVCAYMCLYVRICGAWVCALVCVWVCGLVGVLPCGANEIHGGTIGGKMYVIFSMYPIILINLSFCCFCC